MRILVLRAGNADFVEAACAETDRPGCFICKAESQAVQVCRALLKKTPFVAAKTVTGSHHLSCSALSDQRGRTGHRNGRYNGSVRDVFTCWWWSRTPLFLWLSSCRVRQPRPSEMISLIPRVSGVVFQRQSPFGPVGSVSESVTVNRTKVEPVGAAVSLGRTPFYPPLACRDCKWVGYQGKQIRRAWFRGVSQSARMFNLFTEVPCWVCKWAFLLPDDVC